MYRKASPPPHCQLQAEFVESEAWSVPTEPECDSAEFERDEVEAARSGSVEGSALERSLLQALVAPRDDMPEGDFYSIAICQRPGATVAVVKAFWDSHEVVQQPAPLSLIRIAPRLVERDLPGDPGPPHAEAGDRRADQRPDVGEALLADAEAGTGLRPRARWSGSTAISRRASSGRWRAG